MRRLAIAAVMLAIVAGGLSGCEKEENQGQPDGDESNAVGVDGVEGEDIAAMKDSAEAVAEFARLLPEIAAGKVTDKTVTTEFLKLAQEHEDVRNWIVEEYERASNEQKHTLMICVLTAVQEKTCPEFVPLLKSALREEGRYSIIACKALRYCDMEGRRELLLRFIDPDKVSEKVGEYHTQSALRVYLDLYGLDGIEEALEKLLSQKVMGRRGKLAAIVVAHADEPWRSRGLEVLNEVIGDGAFRNWYDVGAMFEELAETDACGDETLLETAKRISSEGNDFGRKTANEYIERCSGAE